MRALARHRLTRFAACLLLAWICVDLCWLDAAGGDAADAQFVLSGIVHSEECGLTHGGVLHPDDCCCHAHYLTLAGDVPLLSSPTFTYLGSTPLLAPPMTDASPLYHPPQSSI